MGHFEMDTEAWRVVLRRRTAEELVWSTRYGDVSMSGAASSLSSHAMLAGRSTWQRVKSVGSTVATAGVAKCERSEGSSRRCMDLREASHMNVVSQKEGEEAVQPRVLGPMRYGRVQLHDS